MTRPLIAALLALVLSACTGQNVRLEGRTTGVTAQGKFQVLRPDGEVSLTVGSEIYKGRWTFAEGWGFRDLSTTDIGGMRSIMSAAGGLPTGSRGGFSGTSASGGTLRCTFDFSEWNSKGRGTCEDSRGETYDLQIDG